MTRAAVARFHGAPPTHLTLPDLEALGIRHAFTTRHHGSVVERSPAAHPPGAEPGPALRALGVEGRALRRLRQVHGVDAVLADDAPPGLVGTGDALITTRPGHPLAIFSADCLAVIVAQPERRILAAAHVGWRGTVAGLLGRLVVALTARFEVPAARLVAAIGPSIGPCCYEVDGPVIEPLRAAFPAEWTRWTRPRVQGRWWLDLWQANADQLTAAGVAPEAILNPRLCTGCRRDLFFSYRKEGPGPSLAALALLP